MIDPFETTTKEEFETALADEKAYTRHAELERLRTRAVSPKIRQYAEVQLYREYGLGDLVKGQDFS